MNNEMYRTFGAILIDYLSNLNINLTEFQSVGLTTHKDDGSVAISLRIKPLELENTTATLQQELNRLKQEKDHGKEEKF